MFDVAGSPIHPDDRKPTCVMRELDAWLKKQSPPKSLPLPQADFAPAMVEFVKANPSLRGSVGFTDESLQRVMWIRGEVHAKFASGGADAISLLANPPLMIAYKDEWISWVKNLPAAVRTKRLQKLMAGGEQSTFGQELPPADESALLWARTGCAKWGVLATELAFFNGVFGAIVATPLFSLGAIALFVRSIVISYAALYCLVGMILTVFATMYLLGLPLGIVEALALSLVVGMSVDYIIHVAHAYKNSLFADRFFKSRAVVLARAASISAAGITTIAAVAPLLLARLLPLRNFGYIFIIVTAVSLVFAVAFLALLMIIGPMRTRGHHRPPLRTDDGALDGGDGSAWSLQVDRLYT